jgi:hypothetical protein
MPRKLTSANSVDNLRRDAKRWLRALRAHDQTARAHFDRAFPDGPHDPVLRDVQHALAREYGFASWRGLKEAVEQLGGRNAAAATLRTAEEYERLANDLVAAFDNRDETALQRSNEHYGRAFTFDDLWAEVWRRVYAFRQRSSRVPKNYLQLAEAQLLIAQDAGFGSWGGLVDSIESGSSPIPPFEVDTAENRIGPRRTLTPGEWDRFVDTIREQRVTAVDAQGLMTDELLARIAQLEHVIALRLGGSRQLTDAGLQHLARMAQLEYLDLSEYPGGKLTDHGLEVLRHLPNLRRFEMTWQRGITDAGVRNLRFCERLEHVNLMGSPTGDGAIEALQGKFNLSSFSTGKLVTDAGMALLQNFPRLRQWDHTPPSPGSHTNEPGARLLIDGPFTNAGLAGLAGLAGIGNLDLFWHVTAITSEGFAHLVKLPNLEVLGADGGLSDDGAMQYIGQMPRLRRLRIQETAATDNGFEALGRSPTIEGIWARDCQHLGNRGFIALSGMPALRSLGVSLRNVDDHGLALLPRFPSLRELTPIGLTDPGFFHVGRCERLERLTCMYCRESGDVATQHIANLEIKYYYAGLTQITDRSLEILGGMSSLEQVELYECNGVTDAGLPFLARLPNLREVHLDTLPGVTLHGTRVFAGQVRVRYST